MPFARLIDDALIRLGYSERKAAGIITDAAWDQDHKTTTVHASAVSRWRTGVAIAQPNMRRWTAAALQIPLDELNATAKAQRHAQRQAKSRTIYGATGQVPIAGTAPKSLLVMLPNFTAEQMESLRTSLHDAISDSGTSEASLSYWEQTVLAHGWATRYRPPGAMLTALASDLTELNRAVDRCRSSSTMRRLTRMIAQMAGLMCLTLIKLDERRAFHSWARTARIAAQEAGDVATSSWVLAQEAYGHYYGGDYARAIDVAREAQALSNTASVGAVLASALQARAHAALGQSADTLTALARAEETLSRLDSDVAIPSAFGYNEAQLRFHEGNALTHLHDTNAAWNAQERALALYPPGDYTDRSLTQLDRAACLVNDGDLSGAVLYASRALADLTNEQRSGIITLRARSIVSGLPSSTSTLPAARELRDLVALTTETQEATDE